LPANAGNGINSNTLKSKEPVSNIVVKYDNFKNIYYKKSDNDIIKSFKKTNSLSERFSKYLNDNQIDIISKIPIPNQSTQKQIENDSNTNIEIESDIQYQIEDVFVAEGNVVLRSRGGILYADKVRLNKTNKIFIAEKNVRIYRGDQYLESSFFEYDYGLEEGILKKVYGVMDLSSFSEDLNLKNNIKVEKENYSNKLNKINLIDESKFVLSGINDGYRVKSPRLRFNLSAVSKWRFKAEEVKFNTTLFKSDEVFFTNDAYNKPQFILKSRDFSGELIKDKLKLTSKASFIILDDKLKIPIGRRTIYDRDPISTWGIGSDYQEKDGLYIYKSFNNKSLSENLSLKVTPYFLIQRAYKGKTSNYAPKTKSLLADKEEEDTIFSDYLAADLEIEANIGDWQLNLENNLSSFNLDRSRDFLSSNLLLSKNIFENRTPEDKKSNKNSFSELIDFEIFSSFRNNVWKGLSGQGKVYYGYGTRLISYNSWTEGFTTRNTYLNLDVGSFKAKKKVGRSFITRERVTLTGLYGSRFQLWVPEGIDKTIDASYRYSPDVIQKGLYFNKQIGLGLFEYSDGKSQQALEFKASPELILGSQKNNFFDYSKLKAEYTYAVRHGQSPFLFDSVQEKSRVKLYLQQQIYGPLTFSFHSSVNLEPASDDYGKFKSKTYEVFFNRRAYQISAYLNDDDKF